MGSDNSTVAYNLDLVPTPLQQHQNPIPPETTFRVLFDRISITTLSNKPIVMSLKIYQTFTMLQTSMNFLSRDDLYQTEKPYLCLFETPEDFPKSNIRLSKCKDLRIEDIRVCDFAFSLDTHGFAIMPLKSKLSYADFGDSVKVKGQYLREVAEQLRCFTGASRVQIFEHLVCIYHFLICCFRNLPLH